MFKALKKLPIYLENRLLVNFQSIMLMVAKSKLNPIKAGGSESMYSLGGRPTPLPP